MDIFVVKLWMFVIIFLFGIGGGILPTLFGKTKYGYTLLTLGNAFAGGIFLGAGMIHLLGDSHKFFAEAIETFFAGSTSIKSRSKQCACRLAETKKPSNRPLSGKM